MSRLLNCLKSATLSQISFVAQRMIFNEAPQNRPAEVAEEPKGRSTDLADFMKKDPKEAIGNVAKETIDLGKSKSENIRTTQTTLAHYVDKLVSSYDGSAQTKEYFRKDLIASLVENRANNEIERVVGSGLLKIDKVEMEVVNSPTRGAYISVIGYKTKGHTTMDTAIGLSVVDIPLKSSSRKKIETQFQAVKQGTQEALKATSKKAEEMIEGGKKRTTEYQEKQKATEIADTQGNYTREALKEIMGKRVKLDKGVYEKWTKLNVSDPEVFKDISNIENLTSILARPPFKWSLGQLHKSIQDGNDSIVEFDDLIDEEGLGLMDDDKFAKTYEQLVKDIESGKVKRDGGKNGSKLDHYNKIIAQAKLILDALSPDKFHIQGLKEEKKADVQYQNMLEKARSLDSQPQVAHFYSYTKLEAGKVLAKGEYETQEAQSIIGVGTEAFTKWKAGLSSQLKTEKSNLNEKSKNVNESEVFSNINGLDEATVLRMLGDVYGYAKLVEAGHIIKANGVLILNSIPDDFNPFDDKYKKLFSSIESKKGRTKYDSKEAERLSVEKMDNIGKLDAFLKKVFNQKDIGEALNGGKGQIMDLTVADGIHSSVYKDDFKTFLTGESAYVASKAKIWESAEAKGGSFEKEATEKTLTLMNAYLKLGAMNAKIVLGSDKEIPELTAKDILAQNVTEDQINAIKIGATVAWTQEAKMDSAEGNPVLNDLADKPALQTVARDFFWKNPGLSVADQKEVVDAIKKIDLGSIGVAVSKNEKGEVSGVGIGYSKTFALPKGLTLRLGIGASNNGVATGASVSKSHELGKGRLTWEIGVGSGVTSASPVIGASVGYEFDFAEYRRIGVTLFGGVGIEGAKVGVALGYRVDQNVKYSVEKRERLESLDFNQLIEFIKSDKSIEEKVEAIKANKHCGELMNKMSVVFEDMSKAFGKPITAEMRQDLILQTFNTILSHVKTDFDKDWKPEFLNSVGLVFTPNVNFIQSIKEFIGGLISFSFQGKTHVIPVAEKGIIHGNEKVLDKKLLDKLRLVVAQEQGVEASQVEVTPDMLTNEGLLTRIASAEGGNMEYRATNAPEKTSEADLQRNDIYGGMKTAFDDAHIDFNRKQDDPTKFTMDVKDFGNTELNNSNIILSVDPELQKYVDVIGDAGNKFQIRFKDGFTKFGKLLISRQDIFTPMRYNGAPRTVRIMLKADLVSDSVLAEANKQTGLYKFDGYKTTEKGLNSENNSLYTSEDNYFTAVDTKYLQLNNNDKTTEEIQESTERDAALAEHRSLWGLEAPQMRSAEALDGIVKDFTKALAKSKDQKYIDLYNAIVGEKVATSFQTEQIMKGLQEFAAEQGLAELNSYELEYAKNLFSINTFTDVRGNYIKGDETPEVQHTKLNTLKTILKRRQGLFKRIADQMFAQTTEGSDPKVRKQMVEFLNTRMLQKIDALTVADISNEAFAGINRENLGQFLGSMAGRLADRKQGRLADLDAYGSATPGEAHDMMAYGIKEFSVSNQGIEGRVARAIIEIEYPHNENLEGKAFLDQALSVQIAINADKFFTAEEITNLNSIKKGEAFTDATKATFEKFKELVNFVRASQMNNRFANEQGLIVVPMGPKFQNVTIYIKPITVKDFFFEKCGNQSWGVDGNVQFFKPQEQSDRPVVVGAQKTDYKPVDNRTTPTVKTTGLGGAYTQEISEKPTKQDNTKDPLGEDNNPTAEGITTGSVGDPVQ